MAKVNARFLADNSGMARAMTGPQGAATLLAARAARQIEAQAKTNAPVSTGGGTLRNRTQSFVTASKSSLPARRVSLCAAVAAAALVPASAQVDMGQCLDM